MPKSPQLGYNHNIPHRGRLFHVQTEDSGRGKSHIYSHIFHDGTIIATNKVDYEKPSDAPDFDEYVIGLMQASHKQLIVRLRRSEFDEKIVALLGEFPQASAPPAVEERVAAAAKEPEETTSAREAVEQTLLPIEAATPAEKVAPQAQAVAIAPPPEHAVTVAPETRSLPRPSGPLPCDPLLAHPSLSAATGPWQRPAWLEQLPPLPQTTEAPRRLQRRAIPGVGGQAAASTGAAAMLPLRDVILASRGGSEKLEAFDAEILRLVAQDMRSTTLPEGASASNISP